MELVWAPPTTNFKTFEKDVIAGAMGSREVQEYVIANKTQRATPESSTLLELHTEAKTFAVDIELYQRIELAQAVLQPIVMCTIRVFDSDRPTASKIQYTKYQVQEKLKTVTVEVGKEPWAEDEYDWDEIMHEVIAIHRYRWDYGYTIVQGTRYLLDPEYVDMDQHQDPETMEAFRCFVEKCYVLPDALPEEATEEEMLAHEKERDEVMRQRAACDLRLLEYKMKRGVFARDVVWENAKNISAVDFWFLYGICVKELQYVGMRATAQVEQELAPGRENMQNTAQARGERVSRCAIVSSKGAKT
ncbi:hypothetical protein CYMTET_18338 [Cymbomonas tetramitiformis]|uniref:Uncharacterized protein n=1 Tax=Cymbomonas tetramitiformis TaxID=36881 RepID=A0AAE0G8Q2_9CHLO|nr:hypothetical protein CYMTET_18338 [Cymbomonas tetramitiformis]